VYFVSETAQVELETWTSVSPCAAVDRLHDDMQLLIVVRRCRLTL